MEIPQNLRAVLDDLKPEDAIRIKPDVTAEYNAHVQASSAAEAEAHRFKDICDANNTMAIFIAAKQSQATAKLAELKTALRREHYALREDFAVEDQTAIIRKLTDVMNFYDTEHEFLMAVQHGADEIQWLDSLERLALCKMRAAHTAAFLSHVLTVSTLGDAYAGEGSLGVVGQRTLKLQQEAALSVKQYESAKQNARESRLAYDRQLIARSSRGLVVNR